MVSYCKGSPLAAEQETEETLEEPGPGRTNFQRSTQGPLSASQASDTKNSTAFQVTSQVGTSLWLLQIQTLIALWTVRLSLELFFLVRAHSNISVQPQDLIA